MIQIRKIYNKKAVIAVVIYLIVVGIAMAVFNGDDAPVTSQSNETLKTVSLIALNGNQENSGGKITASGNVSAEREANLVAETSGVVSAVYVDIGSDVVNGQPLITLSNADAVAQVAQARAQVSAAQSAASSTKIGINNDAVTLMNAIGSVARILDDVRETKVAPLFDEPKELDDFGITWRVDTTTYFITAPLDKYLQINSAADRVIEATDDLETSIERNDLDDVLSTARSAEEALLAMRTLLDLISEQVNRYNSGDSADQVVYDRFQSNISTGRTSISSAITTLSSAVQSYRSSQSRDVLSPVEQARASLMAAEAQLAKTVIRAPFSGRVLSVSPHVGEYLNMGSPAVSLLSTAGKVVNFYLNADDAAQVSVGKHILIEDERSGTVIRKAPGINPATGKIEVVASLSSNTVDVAVGEFVNITIPVGISTNEIQLPLKAVKMTSAGAEVYVVTDGVVSAVPVKVGALEGEYVTIESGLGGLSHIIENVRGISAGDKVTVL